MDRTTRTYTEGRTNKALEKLAEETTQGLAQDEKLHLIDGKRRVQGGAWRDPWKTLNEQLTDDEQNAAKEIMIAHKVCSGWLHFRTMVLERTGGGSQQELSERITGILIRYDRWRKSALIKKAPEILNITLDVFGQGLNFKDVERRYHGMITDKTAKKYCIIGLREYVEINS
jgi:hypothetical protein